MTRRIDVLRIPVADALDWLRGGQVDSTWPLVALQWLAVNREGPRAAGP